MKRTRLTELPDNASGHFLKGLLPGQYLRVGGLSFHPPGARSHDHDGPGGRDIHVHADDCEAFVILQGRGVMQLDDEELPLRTGDVFLVEPGEDHHVVSSQQDPLVLLWLHAGPQRHEKQRQG